MPFNGNGTFTRLFNWTADAGNNLPISATKFDGEDNDFASGFGNCLTRDGQGAPTGPLTWTQPLTINVAADGTDLAVGRTGGANNPQLQVKLADASGATLNLSTAQTLALGIQGTNVISVAAAAVTVAQPTTINAALTTTVGGSSIKGNLTVTAPGAGTSLNVLSLTTAQSIVAGITGASNNPRIFLTHTEASGLSDLSFTGSANFNGTISVGNSAVIALSNSRNVTINAPGSGTTFTALSNTGAQSIIAGITSGANNPRLFVTHTEASGLTDLNFSGSSNFNGTLSVGGGIVVSLSNTSEFGIVTPTTIGNLVGGTIQAGYMDTPQHGITANTTLALTDRGKSIYITGTTAAQTLTIPANASVAFPVGTTIIVVNLSNQNWSIAITTDTLEWLPSTSTGTRTLAAGSILTLYKDTSTHWLTWGFGII